MWADFLSHFQDESKNAAYFEAELGDNIEDNVGTMGQPRSFEESKTTKEQNDGGSGGTSKIDNDEEEENQAKKKKKIDKQDVFDREAN